MQQRKSIHSTVFSVAILAVQVAIHPFLVRTFVPVETPLTAFIILCETGKIILGVTVYALASCRLSVSSALCGTGSIKGLVVIAAFLVVQSIAVSTAQRNLSLLLYNVISQTKLLSTAVVGSVIERKRLSSKQIVGLVLLGAGVSIMVSGGSDSTKQIDSSIMGVSLALLASALSGLTSSLSDSELRARKVNAYLFSAALSSYVVCLTVAGLMIDYMIRGSGSELFQLYAMGGFLSSSGITRFDSPAILPILSAAFGGIIVGHVTKILGSIKKGFAVSIGVLLSAIIDNSSLTWRVMVAIPLSIIGVVVFSLEAGRIKKS
jgi:UDP-sugar transporter A1/2/3